MRKTRFFLLIIAVTVVMQLFCAYAEDALKIKNSSLPTGDAGEVYSAQLTASGGSGEGYKFSIVKGRLPRGLDLSEDGVVSGTPTESGNFSGIQFCVTDSEGNSVVKKVRLVIRAISVTFTVSNNTFMYDGQPHTATVTPSVPELEEGVDYTALFGGELSQTMAGNYSVSIRMINVRYKVESVVNAFMTINKIEGRLRGSGRTFIYDGEPKEIVFTAEPSDMEYTVTYTGVDGTSYGPSNEPPTAVGSYSVVAEPANYSYDVSAVRVSLRINPVPVDMIVSDFDVVYEKGVKHKATVVPRDDADLDKEFSVTYDNLATAEVEELTEVEDAGSYRINVVFEGFFTIGSINTRTMTVRPKTVPLTAESATQIYNKDLEYSIDIAVVDDSDFNEYTVIYTYGGNTYENKVKRPGEYEVSVRSDNPNYTLTFPSGITLTIMVAEKVDFTIEDNVQTYDPAIKEYHATIIPAIEGFYKYEVTYIPVGDDTAEGAGSVTTDGSYNIVITLTDERCELGEITGETTFTLNKLIVDFTIADNVKTYDPAVKEYGATVTPSIDGFDLYAVTYRPADDDTAEGASSVTSDGDYSISIAMTDNLCELGEISGETTFTLNKLVVGFTIADNVKTYDPAVKEYGATVTPAIDGFDLYSVTYRLADDDTAEGASSVTTDGDYIISIAMTDNLCELGEITGETTFTLNKLVVGFTIADNVKTYNPAVKEYGATVTPAIDGFDLYSVTYRPADDDTAEGTSSVTTDGAYSISIAMTDNLCELGEITGETTFTLNKLTVGFTIADNVKTYDHVAKEYGATVTPSVDGFDLYAVTYRPADDDEAEGANSVTTDGSYNITITLTDELCELGEITGETTFTLNKLIVDFRIDNNVKTYTPAAKEYGATVTPSIDGFDSYTVTYRLADNETAAGVNSVTVAGSYNIVITLTDELCELGEITGETTFTLNKLSVIFTASDLEKRYRSDITQKATITPPDNFTDDFAVTYDNLATEEVEAADTVQAIGDYRITVTTDSPNYTITLAEPNIFRIIGQIGFNYGNSPYGLIMREQWSEEERQQAKTAFAENRRFTELVPSGASTAVAYSAAAWSGGVDLDLDENAIFAYSLNLLDDTGCYAYHSDGTEVEQSEITTEICGLKELKGVGIGAMSAAVQLADINIESELVKEYAAKRLSTDVYKIRYSFTDKLTDELVSAERSLVLLSRTGDTNLDGNVNSADGNYIKSASFQNTEGATALYLYRVCDVNMDGVVDADDAAVIYGRFETPIVQMYK